MLKEEENLFPYLREVKYNGKNDNAALQSLKQKIQLQKTEHEKSFN